MHSLALLMIIVMAVGIAPAAVTNRVKLALAEHTPSSTVSASKLEPVSKLSPIILKDLEVLTFADRLPSSVVQEIVALVSADRLPSSVVQEIVALVSADRLPPSVVQEIVALWAVEKLTEQNLVDIAMLVESKKLELSVLKSFVALLKIENQSRFNALSPSMFSTLWVIKMKGLKAERNNENSDDLWKKYWDVFMRAED